MAVCTAETQILQQSLRCTNVRKRRNSIVVQDKLSCKLRPLSDIGVVELFQELHFFQKQMK